MYMFSLPVLISFHLLLTYCAEKEKKARRTIFPIIMHITGIDMEDKKAFGTSIDHSIQRGMVLPFLPLSLAFHHVNYYVNMPAVSPFSHIFTEHIWRWYSINLWFPLRGMVLHMKITVMWLCFSFRKCVPKEKNKAVSNC